jgi:palmitoyltransferase
LTQLDIFAAARQGNIERIRALNESGRARATDRDEDNVTPLHWAAIKGQDAACTYLIEQGAEVNAVGGKELATPLHWVARNGLVTTIDLLIQHGADPRLLDAQGHNCLHSVAHSGKYLALLYVVCRPEIAIDEPDSLGYTPLHYAVYWRDEVSTHILLKLGANPNVVGHDGLTPLHWAAFKGSKKCIKGLLEAGADIRAKDKNRCTAEEIASEFRNRDKWNVVVEELGIKADGSRVRRPLSEVCRNPWFSLARGCTKEADVAAAQREYHRLLCSHDLTLHRFSHRGGVSMVYEYHPLTSSVLRSKSGLQPRLISFFWMS